MGVLAEGDDKIDQLKGLVINGTDNMRKANIGLHGQRQTVENIADSNNHIAQDLKQSNKLISGIERVKFIKFVMLYAVIVLMAFIIAWTLISKIFFFL